MVSIKAVTVYHVVAVQLLARDARSTKRSIAIITGRSVRHPVCKSLSLKYFGRIGWTDSKLITKIWGVRMSEPQHRQICPTETLQNRLEWGGRCSV